MNDTRNKTNPPRVQPESGEVRDELDIWCRFIDSLYAPRAPDATAWLTRAALGIASIIRPGTGCWIMDAGSGNGAKRWRPHAFAISGAGATATRRFREEAKSGFPSDDTPRDGSVEFGPTSGAGLNRSRLFPANTWATSRYKALCAEPGVQDFARAVHAAGSDPIRRWIVVEAQGYDAGWKADHETRRVLGVATQAVTRAYGHLFIQPEELRESLTRRISPAGRPVLPLLAQGLSEPEIGTRVHRSAHTVHDHVKQIYRTLGVSNRFELRDVWFGDREPPPASD